MTTPFVMSQDEAVELWNSASGDYFEAQLVDYAAKAINFYTDTLPGSAAPTQGADARLIEALEAQISVTSRFAKLAGFDQQAISDCTSQACRAVSEVQRDTTDGNCGKCWPHKCSCNGIATDTGNAQADRVINRLDSSDPDFDDCVNAVAFIRRLVAEHKGPDGFATWKDAAIHERQLRGADARPVAITVWKDGSWKQWQPMDAMYAESDPDWLTTIRLDAAPSADSALPENTP